MTSGGKRKGPKDRAISDEEAAMWHEVARTAKRLRLKPRVTAVEMPDPASMPPRASLPKAAGKRAAASEPGHSPKSTAPRPAKPPAPAPRVPLAEFDRRTVRRIASGRIEIEARLDLHGERQSTAHGMLRQFLMRAQADGKKTVLVITGKGVRARDDEAQRPLFDEDRRGILKRMVPQWLAEPELRAVVLSFTEAAPRHGGHGALYVHLRRGS